LPGTQYRKTAFSLERFPDRGQFGEGGALVPTAKAGKGRVFNERCQNAVQQRPNAQKIFMRVRH